jgi:hypothetical protein
MENVKNEIKKGKKTTIQVGDEGYVVLIDDRLVFIPL